METNQRPRVPRFLHSFTETFGLNLIAATALLLFIAGVVLFAIAWSIYSAPPHTLTITSGPPGSGFEHVAEEYSNSLAKVGVKLKILTSQGSLENLQRLEDPSFRVDIGFAQAGEAQGDAASKLFSLGSVSYQPLLIFYRGTAPVNLLSDFAGRKVAVGPPGSGTRQLALQLLETNGIVPGGSTVFLDLDAAAAAKAMLDGKADVVFLMGDSASSQLMRSLLRTPGIQIFDFTQADAYTRRITFLNKLDLPRGAIDFGADVPSHDVTLIGPTVELVARSSLHPALSDLLLETAKEVHGNPSLLQHRGEFPAPLKFDLKISPDATRYYKSGKTFMYQKLPFWLASLVNRLLVAVVPMILLIPALKLIPTAYKWRVQLRINRWYRNLLRVERELFTDMSGAKRKELTSRLDEIEAVVNRMKVPASFASQFYGLREHIGFVRERLAQN